MALPVRDQLKYWGIAAAVFSVVLWFLGDVLLPFVLGGAIAYCLDPVADWLERVGLSRGAATALITVGTLLLFIIMTLAVIPLLIQQAIALFEFAPQLFRDLRSFLTERFPNIMDEGSIVHSTLIDLGETIKQKGGQLIQAALASVGSILNLVTLFLITPVVSVYLLVDWDRMVARIDELVPLDHKPVVRHLASEVDRVLAGFIRGMGSVSIILGTYYAVALWVVGLQFGPVVGVIAGMLTFIPYVGAIVGGVLAVGLALFQFWGEWWWIVAVYAIFQSGQFVEGNILTPNLVGSSVGLHPVWLLLALSVFGSLFGFIGLLVAVPLAAALGVIARFLIQQYKGSRLFLGLSSNGSFFGDDEE
ncbi:AI-2E family transporter [Mameliella sediminis]|uniref:AI-2E family transporter n=1 Tax=Mameliella sediminis TaxID=2836866 RepID=UPI001C43E473|nr:AI-2E family transporter [Mameliella sediminis]MBY6115781.1 AI-2E family transporter [Antarctobacter heliothermus]MBY6145441.1 AI-2E family transporter [Mameliella alba]MBV7393835.1 AI-2E family transporter [Mameliella sediminis]MBY6162251.1 AI-2E family transporter [Mameliella alba]MBY6170720.1 AI-2E family transporter [Mameliella alba]